MTLAEGVRSKEKDILAAREAGQDITDHEASRKLLHTLVAATNRRMYKGFQEMLTYLLRKPMGYCSHEFVSCTFETLLRKAFASVHVRLLGQAMPANHQVRSDLPLPVKVALGVADYSFRPSALENFPLYFFLAGCEATRTLSSGSMTWVSLPIDGGAGVLYHHSRHSEPVFSKAFPNRCFVDDVNTPIYRYAYYVRLRTDKSWKVPVLYGRHLAVPDDAAPAAEKASYALFLMVLFRPRRRVDDLISDIFHGAGVRGSEDSAWTLIDDERTRWRGAIENVAKECFRNASTGLSSGPPPSKLHATEPPFDSREWWAFVIHEKLRNYDCAKKRHDTDTTTAPDNISALPLFLEPQRLDSNAADVSANAHDLPATTAMRAC